MKGIVAKIRPFVAAVRALLTDRTHHQPANFANIKALLLHLCDYDHDKCLWVMRWLAYPLRNPGAKMDMALVVNGEQGTGKGLFFDRVVARLYDPGTARIIPASQLFASFTRWGEGTRLAIVDGVFSKKNAARLKELVTTKTVSSQGRLRRTHANFIFVSNSSEFLPVIETDRRLFVLEVGPARTFGFYQAIMHEIANGGVDAFREYLMRGLDMSGFDEHTRPPVHPAMREVLREVA